MKNTSCLTLKEFIDICENDRLDEIKIFKDIYKNDPLYQSSFAKKFRTLAGAADRHANHEMVKQYGNSILQKLPNGYKMSGTYSP